MLQTREMDEIVKPVWSLLLAAVSSFMLLGRPSPRSAYRDVGSLSFEGGGGGVRCEGVVGGVRDV
jgi:hypothetical protein